MFIPHYSYKKESNVSLDQEYKEFEHLIDEFKEIDETETYRVKGWDGLEINYSRKNKFFKGFIITIPISLFLWAGIILILKSIFQ